ncbi:MAG: RNA methyltransferase [Thermodesulfovibrionales bacterium]|nr:RNA methyltransferase [Thermodesulfovibrionales bacterium]
MWKDNISFILVEPREPGNIGASARAIKNMGFLNLELVNPFREKIFNEKEIKKRLEDSEARWFATDAIDILRKVRIHRTLHDAISDKSLVVGTTRRIGKRRGVILSVKEGIKRILEVASSNRVAILFGREDKGLFNEEVKECGFLMTIPTSKRSPSLNLAQAVLIIAYELHCQVTEFSNEKEIIEMPLIKFVNHEDIDDLLKRIREALKTLGYIPRGDRDLEEKVMNNLGFLLRRAGLTDWELNMLHGICTAVIRAREDMQSVMS